MNIFKAIKRFVFGYDIFISYSRKDSLDYAYSIARHFMKKEYGYDCYIDQLSSTEPGKKIPANILNALKNSTAFVIIGSAGAMNSKPIGEELTTFKKTKHNNPIIPIDIDGRIFSSEWYHEIEGLAIIDEKEDSFFNKQASSETLERIRNSLNFTKKSKKLRRTAFAFLAFFVVSIFASVLLFTQVSKAKEELRKTSRQIRQEQMQGLIYLSKITAPVNTVIALKHALKAYTDYRDVDTTNAAEKNLLDLYNNNDIVIKNNFSTGGTLSPGGKYIHDGNLYFISTKRKLYFNEGQEPSFSPDDEIASVNDPGEIRIYRVRDTLLINRFPLKDSFGYTLFDRGNQFVFIGNQPSDYSDTDKARIRVLDRKTYRIIADTKIPGKFSVQGYSHMNGGTFLLHSGEQNQGSYTWNIPTGNLQQIRMNEQAQCLLVRHSFTDSGSLLLEQSVTAKKMINPPYFKSTDSREMYSFRIRLMNFDGNVLEDSVFVEGGIIKIPREAVHASGLGKLLLFGTNGFLGTYYLLNTGNRPFQTPQKLKFGTVFNSYELVTLISDKYILAVGFKNEEYTISVFLLTNPGIKEIFSRVVKNHPTANIEDDHFMKSINISYCSNTNFLAIYDRGEGLCTQYFLDKLPVKSAKELMDVIAEKKLFENIAAE